AWKGAGCFRRYSNEMQMTTDWPLVSTAVFAGGANVTPPGMGRGGSENAAAPWISAEGPNGPPDVLYRSLALSPNRTLTLSERSQETPRPDALKWRRSRCGPNRGSHRTARPSRLEGRGARTTRPRCAAAPLHAGVGRISDPPPALTSYCVIQPPKTCSQLLI
ncbi:hypothetical protein J0S82_016843, partial [Galemys pyrenaicus]